MDSPFFSGEPGAVWTDPEWERYEMEEKRRPCEPCFFCGCRDQGHDPDCPHAEPGR